MPSPRPAEPAIRYEDRIFITGKTRSGKSQLARRLFLATAGQRLVLDPVDSDMTRIPGAVTFSDPAKATNAAGQNWWTATTARFVPDDPDDLDAYSAVMRRVYNAGRPRIVWVDEAGLIMPASGANKGGRKLLLAGAKLGIGMICCHTRPRNVDVDAIAQASHDFIFHTPKIEDRRYLADNIGIDLATFEAAHAEAIRREHGFLWSDQRANRLTIAEPLA